MIQIETIVVGSLDVNCYIVYNEKKECFIIDPGDDHEDIMGKIDKLELKPQLVLLTHGHFDHVLGAERVLKELGDIPVYIHEKDFTLLEHAAEFASVYGIQAHNPGFKASVVTEGCINAGDMELQILHTPGHSKGGISVYLKDAGALFTGDLIFEDSVGRTDLPGGSFKELKDSVIKKIYSKPDDTILYPGHGGISTVGKEKIGNPYVRIVD